MRSDPDHETIDQIIERVTVDAYGDAHRGVIADTTNTGQHRIAPRELDLGPGQAGRLLEAYRRWFGQS